jgi:hypothetical protein
VCRVTVTQSIHLSSPTVFLADRPLRSLRPNRGKGGAVAQLQAVAKIICSDATKKKKMTNILQDVPLNAMAPVEKVKLLPFFSIVPDVGRFQTHKGGEADDLLQDDPPLQRNLRKPVHVDARPGSIFGFRPGNGSKNETDVEDTPNIQVNDDHRSTAGSEHSDMYFNPVNHFSNLRGERLQFFCSCFTIINLNEQKMKEKEEPA